MQPVEATGGHAAQTHGHVLGSWVLWRPGRHLGLARPIAGLLFAHLLEGGSCAPVARRAALFIAGLACRGWRRSREHTLEGRLGCRLRWQLCWLVYLTRGRPGPRAVVQKRQEADGPRNWRRAPPACHLLVQLLLLTVCGCFASMWHLAAAAQLWLQVVRAIVWPKAVRTGEDLLVSHPSISTSDGSSSAITTAPSLSAISRITCSTLRPIFATTSSA
jgi:hypothetical protein